MYGMMNGGSLMWGAGSGWVLICALVALGFGILVASLFLRNRR